MRKSILALSVAAALAAPALAAAADPSPVTGNMTIASDYRFRGISQTAGAYATDEPFVPLRTNAAVSSNPADGTVNQIAQLQMGGFNDAGEMLTLRAAIADYSQWSTTPLDYTMNSFHFFDSGTELNGGNFTLAVLQQARNSARIVQAGNHALKILIRPRTSSTGQLANDAHGQAGSVQQLPDSRADHPAATRLAAAVGQGRPLMPATSRCGTSDHGRHTQRFMSFSEAELRLRRSSPPAARRRPPRAGQARCGLIDRALSPRARPGRLQRHRPYCIAAIRRPSPTGHAHSLGADLASTVLQLLRATAAQRSTQTFAVAG